MIEICYLVNSWNLLEHNQTAKRVESTKGRIFKRWRKNRYRNNRYRNKNNEIVKRKIAKSKMEIVKRA